MTSDLILIFASLSVGVIIGMAIIYYRQVKVLEKELTKAEENIVGYKSVFNTQSKMLNIAIGYITDHAKKPNIKTYHLQLDAQATLDAINKAKELS